MSNLVQPRPGFPAIAGRTRQCVSKQQALKGYEKMGGNLTDHTVLAASSCGSSTPVPIENLGSAHNLLFC